MKRIGNKIDNYINRTIIFRGGRKFVIESLCVCNAQDCRDKCLLNKKKADLREIGGSKYTSICMNMDQWEWEVTNKIVEVR